MLRQAARVWGGVTDNAATLGVSARNLEVYPSQVNVASPPHALNIPPGLVEPLFKYK